MPEIKEDIKALNWLASPESKKNPRIRSDIMSSLNLGEDDIGAWDYANKNPLQPRSLEFRNAIYDKVSNAMPATNEQGVATNERMAIKNFIDKEPQLQMKYLEKKGYKTKTENGNVLVRKPTETRWNVIDPKGFDLWDFGDFLTDIGEGVVTGLATGAKAIGSIGGPLGLGVASLAGGVAGAGYETGKQTVAKGLGLRDEYNPSEIVQAGIVNAAVPGVTKAAGKVLQKTGQGLGWILNKAGVKLKPNAKEIEAASKEIGAEATPGQLFDSKLVQNLESAQNQSVGKIGGMGLRKQIAENQKAAQKAAEDIVSEASGLTSFETGAKAGKEIVDSVAKKLKPAEDIYQKYETIFSRGAYKPDLSRIEKTLLEMKNEFKLNDKALRLIDDFESKLPKIKNLDDVKEFRTLVRDMVDPMDKANKRIVTKLGRELTEVRSDTLKNLASSSNDPKFFKAAIEEIEKADSIYKNTISEIEKGLLKPGAKIKEAPKAAVNTLLNKTPEIDRINKILTTGNPKKIEEIKKAFPEAFESLRQGKIEEIAQRAKNPRDLAKIVSKLPQESAELIFGKDRVLKSKALKTVLENVPPMLGPSGTPQGMEFFQLFNVVKQLNSLGRDALLDLITKPQLGQDIISKAGRALTGKTATGLGVFGARGFINKKQKEENKNNLYIPQSNGLYLPGR